jgi:hypothetical protein
MMEEAHLLIMTDEIRGVKSHYAHHRASASNSQKPLADIGKSPEAEMLVR